MASKEAVTAGSSGLPQESATATSTFGATTLKSVTYAIQSYDEIDGVVVPVDASGVPMPFVQPEHGDAVDRQYCGKPLPVHLSAAPHGPAGINANMASVPAAAPAVAPPIPNLNGSGLQSTTENRRARTSLYSFLPTEHAVEQVDDEDGTTTNYTIAARRSRSTSPSTRQLALSSDLHEDSGFRSAGGSAHAVVGLDGPHMRGVTLDDVPSGSGSNLTERPFSGLPAVPESVLEFGGGRVVVAARIRPQTALEIAEGGCYCLEVGDDDATVFVGGLAGMSRDASYTLNRVLDDSTTQAETYTSVAHPIVEGALYGFNGTIFAYGQTSSGKTYTTFGATPPVGSGGAAQEDGKGIIPRAIETIFDALRRLPPQVEVDVTVQMVELYQDKVRDLLVRRSASGAAIPSAAASSLSAVMAPSSAAASTVSVPVPGVTNTAAHTGFAYAGGDRGRGTSPRRDRGFASPTGAGASALSPATSSSMSVDVSRSATPQRAVSPRSSSPRPREGPASPRFTPLRSPTAMNSAHLLGEDDPDNLSVVFDATFGSQITGATTLSVRSDSQLLDVLRIGANNRVVAATGMNAESSRSHCLVTVTILQSAPAWSNPTASQPEGELGDECGGSSPGSGTGAGATVNVTVAPQIRFSKLYFVDLAGSERPAKSKVVGMQLAEAQAINSSLSALGSVINALANNSAHVPYRDNKLTRVLQDGLGNNSRTALIINVSPSSYNVEETKSSLRFGAAAVRVRTRSTSNVLSPHDMARKDTLSRLQRAKSYSSFVRDSRKTETESKARDRAKKQSLVKQKMHQLRMTNPVDAETIPAPSNVIIPETSPLRPRLDDPLSSFSLGAGAGDGGSSGPLGTPDSVFQVPQALESRASASSDALRAMLRHPSSSALLGKFAHEYFSGLVQDRDAQDAHLADSQALYDAVHGDPDAMYDGHPDAARIALEELYGRRDEHGASDQADYVIHEIIPMPSVSRDDTTSGNRGYNLAIQLAQAGDTSNDGEEEDCNGLDAYSQLPTIEDNDDDDERESVMYTQRSTGSVGEGEYSLLGIDRPSSPSASPRHRNSLVEAPEGSRGRAASSPHAGSGTLRRASSSPSLGDSHSRDGRGSPLTTGASTFSSCDGGRRGHATSSKERGVQLSRRVLAPCEVYTVTYTGAPLGFRFFEPDTATHIMPLLPPLSRAKLPSQANSSISPSLSGVCLSPASQFLSLGSSDGKPINLTATLPVIENVLPGYPADCTPADNHAVAYPQHVHRGLRGHGEHSDEDDEDAAAQASDERKRGWESRGAVAIGDRLLAVNGIRLDLLPVSLEAGLADTDAPRVVPTPDEALAARYAEATNRAVKLVKFAMQAMKRPASAPAMVSPPQSPAQRLSAPTGNTHATAAASPNAGVSEASSSVVETSEGDATTVVSTATSGRSAVASGASSLTRLPATPVAVAGSGSGGGPQPTCTLTFVSAGPFVRKGIIVGLRLAQHHEAQLKKMHDGLLAERAQLDAQAFAAAASASDAAPAAAVVDNSDSMIAVPEEAPVPAPVGVSNIYNDFGTGNTQLAEHTSPSPRGSEIETWVPAADDSDATKAALPANSLSLPPVHAGCSDRAAEDVAPPLPSPHLIYRYTHTRSASRSPARAAGAVAEGATGSQSELELAVATDTLPSGITDTDSSTHSAAQHSSLSMPVPQAIAQIVPIPRRRWACGSAWCS